MVTTCKSSIHLSKESEPSSQGEARQGKEAAAAAAASASPQVRSRIQPWGIFLFVA